MPWPNDEMMAREGLIDGPFRLGVALYDLAWNKRTGWQAMFDPNEGIIHLYRPGGGNEFPFDVRGLHPGQWVRLEAYGRRMPLEVQLTQSGVWGRWLPEDVKMH